MAFLLTRVGSQTKVACVSHIPDGPLTSTPNHLLSSPPWACFYLNLFIISIELRPAFSAIVLGITSKALAKALMIYWVFPLIYLAWCLKYLDNSNSIAPPPATILLALKHLLTIMIASLSDLSAS